MSTTIRRYIGKKDQSTLPQEPISKNKNEMDEETENHYAYIYKCSWFETKRHKTSYTDMYFEKAEDTWWIFESCAWFNGLIRVEYIRVCCRSIYYQVAVKSSSIQNDDRKPSTTMCSHNT